MPRTVLSVQQLDTPGGESLTFQNIDYLNGMQLVNNTRCLVVLRTSGTGNVTIGIPSKADAFGRVGDISVAVGLVALKAYGPFSPSAIWGDGANLLIDFSGGVPTPGTVEIAVITGG